MIISTMSYGSWIGDGWSGSRAVHVCEGRIAEEAIDLGFASMPSTRHDDRKFYPYGAKGTGVGTIYMYQWIAYSIAKEGVPRATCISLRQIHRWNGETQRGGLPQAIGINNLIWIRGT